MKSKRKTKSANPGRLHPVVRRIGIPVTLNCCPPGVFEFDGSLGFKTEYTDPHLGPEAYCLSSGEVFWGGVTNRHARSMLHVQPCVIALNHPSEKTKQQTRPKRKNEHTNTSSKTTSPKLEKSKPRRLALGNNQRPRHVFLGQSRSPIQTFRQ